MPERYPPEDPREWFNRARSNLVLASAQGEGVYLEDLCFNAQQADVPQALQRPCWARKYLSSQAASASESVGGGGGRR